MLPKPSKAPLLVNKAAITQPTKLIKAGELARLTGLTRQALHIYVQMGLLKPSLISRGGHRYYDRASVERIELIQKLCVSGYTLKDVRDIFFVTVQST